MADEPAQGENQREVRAYLCDGKTEALTQWVWGSVTGDELELTFEDGARLEGELSSQAETGAITLADGASLPFSAIPATGIAGLYNVNLSSDGM